MFTIWKSGSLKINLGLFHQVSDIPSVALHHKEKIIGLQALFHNHIPYLLPKNNVYNFTNNLSKSKVGPLENI